MGYGMAGDGLRARYAPQSGGLYYLFQWDPQGSLVQRQTGGPGGNTSYYALDTAMFDGYGAKLGDTDAFTGGAEATRDAMGFQGQFGNDLVNPEKLWSIQKSEAIVLETSI